MSTNVDDNSNSIDTIKAQAELTKGSLKQTARELKDWFLGGGWMKVGERKCAATQHLDTATTAVLDAAAKLKAEDHAAVARQLVGLADTVGHLSHFLESNSPSELADKAADTMKRHPAVSLGVAFVVGAAAARIVRASSKA